MLGELSGSMAHELNQPLTAILSNAQAAIRFLAHDNIDLNEVRDILRSSPGRFIVGSEPAGGIVTADFKDPATPHLLIAGQAGSGKSWLLRAIIASLLHFHGPAAIRFTLMDPKRVTFNVPAFQSAIAAHLDGPVLYSIDDVSYHASSDLLIGIRSAIEYLKRPA